jgi:uncharacterized protein HemX
MSFTAGEIAAYVTALAAVSAMFLQLRRARGDRAKLSAETNQIEAETESMRASTIRQLLADVDTLRKQLDASRAAEQKRAEQLAEAQRQMSDLIARVAVLRISTRLSSRRRWRTRTQGRS